jgi:hypothetical protein
LSDFSTIGTPVGHVDSRDKVTGWARYASYDAVGVRIYRLPIAAESVYRALKAAVAERS